MTRHDDTRPTVGILTTAVAIAALAGAAHAVESTGPGAFPNFPAAGIDLNAFLGATTFYNHGYTGTRAIATVLDGGHIWTGHEALGHATTHLKNQSGAYPDISQDDFHATLVGHALGGRGPTTRQQGIAPGATLWSGAVAVAWLGDPPSAGFSATPDSIRDPLVQALLTGVHGTTTDVLNISWGGGYPTANDYLALRVDAIIAESKKAVVVAAGNNSSSVNSPAAAFNCIAVGALQRDGTPTPYNSVAPWSSRGPNVYLDPVAQQYVFGARAPIALVAPGSNLSLAYYTGVTGANSNGLDPTPGATNLYRDNSEGTSFAAPLVAGGAALITDVGRDRFAGGESIDARVVKSVLMNSADKTSGWTNASSYQSGVLTTIRGVDYAAGAGRMNLDAAYHQYTDGTTNVPGRSGGAVSNIGWDFGTAITGATNDYTIESPLAAGSIFKATLSWFVHNSWDRVNDTSDQINFDNLDLQVWRTDNGTPTSLIAQSIGQYNSVEHLFFAIPATGTYMVRVVFTREMYDFAGIADAEDYALAWSSTTIPAPAGLTVLAFAGIAATFRRRVTAPSAA